MKNNKFSSVFWDFGGVITSSPFEAFNHFEKENNLPNNLIRKINSINHKNNAWALLEQSKISIDEFDDLFLSESKAVGAEIKGKDVLMLLQGKIRPKVVKVLKKFNKLGFFQACLTNNFNSEGKDKSALDDENIERLEILKIFDHVIESKNIGLRKPDLAFYHYVLDLTSCDPKKTIFLDDLGINLKPAKSMGMSTIKVTSEKQLIADLEKLLDFKII
tara:strand:- start:1482 stop:2135 length:654 start_codon:yes stop_codon:yes gene_type:complete